MFKIELKAHSFGFVLPRRWKLPRRELKVELPHVLIEFPEDINAQLQQMEIVRVEIMPFKPRNTKIIFAKIPVS